MGHNFSHKLGLGTVQFGLDYGVSNSAGQTHPDEVLDILKLAQGCGVKVLDTAYSYGDSEAVLGQNLSAEHGFKVVTKAIPIKQDVITPDHVETVLRGFDVSLQRLKQSCVYGFLLHNADDLRAKNASDFYDALLGLKERDAVKKIGVSVYDVQQIEYILDRFEIDLIQVPMNVFDQRLVECGILQRLKEGGVEIHVRSAFLQGVVFMDADDLPQSLQGLKEPLMHFQTMAQQHGCSYAQLALAFLMQMPEVDHVICGVNTPAQLKELVESVQSLPDVDVADFYSLAVRDIKLINPALW